MATPVKDKKRPGPAGAAAPLPRQRLGAAVATWAGSTNMAKSLLGKKGEQGVAEVQVGLANLPKTSPAFHSLVSSTIRWVRPQLSAAWCGDRTSSLPPRFATFSLGPKKACFCTGPVQRFRAFLRRRTATRYECFLMWTAELPWWGHAPCVSLRSQHFYFYFSF